MQLIFVRHAQPVRAHNPDGPADPHLSDFGVWQAARLAEWLAHEPIDYVVTSPKRRAIDTVADLLDGRPHEIHDDFDELDRRANWYYPTEELATAGGEYWEAIKRQEWEAIGWDPPEVFNARVKSALDDLVANRRGDHVLVACHGGVVRRVVSEVFGQDGMRLPINISYASITRIEVSPKGLLTMLSMNEAGHFGAERHSVVEPLGSRPRE